jgi:catechol 2,3-dioxygenase-like lactoylglutathione lyase family enzyme
MLSLREGEMINYRCVNHLAFATGSLERTIRFWRDLLGMRLVLTSRWDVSKIYFFEISEGALIGFFEWPGVEPVEEHEHGGPVTGPFAFDHVSIGVSGDDDLYALKDRMNAADVWVSEVTDHGFIHSIYSYDPNGIPIEFSAFVEGVDIGARPVMMDDDPCEAAREGTEPVSGVWPEVTEASTAEDRRVYPGIGLELFR